MIEVTREELIEVGAYTFTGLIVNPMPHATNHPHGKRVLPEHLQAFKALSIREVLSPQQLAAYRAGPNPMTFEEIGKLYGRSGCCISAYAREALSPEEIGRVKGGGPKAAEEGRCKCGLPGELANLVFEETYIHGSAASHNHDIISFSKFLSQDR